MYSGQFFRISFNWIRIQASWWIRVQVFDVPKKPRSITSKHEISINNSMRCSISWLFYASFHCTSLLTIVFIYVLQRNTVWYIVRRIWSWVYLPVRSGSGSMQRDYNYLTGPVRKAERSQVIHNTNLCWLPCLHTYRTYFHKESSKRFLLWLFAMSWIRIDSYPGLFGQVWSRIRNNLSDRDMTFVQFIK
jgi:hypothetical protein